MAKPPGKKTPAEPKRLSGGNPQIPKGDGDAPVQAFIAAMPGWQRDIGVRLDALIAKATPDVTKAVKWNSPFYGGPQGWFLSFHCFAGYVKVAFFNGADLKPLPPGASKQKDVRYLDIREGDRLDEAQFKDWVKQASRLPGQKMGATMKKATPARPAKKTAKSSAKAVSPSALIDARIAELDDWRGEALARVRKLIHDAAPSVEETWKWRGVPVWEEAGIICTGETYKAAVKLTFAKGAALADPKGLFNASLEGNARRAIDIHEGDALDATAFKALIRAAVALNKADKSKRG